MSPRQRLHPASPDVTRRFLTFAKSLAHWTSKATASTSVRHSAPIVVFRLARVRSPTRCRAIPPVGERPRRGWRAALRSAADEPIGRAAVSVSVGLLRWHGVKVGRYAG